MTQRTLADYSYLETVHLVVEATQTTADDNVKTMEAVEWMNSVPRTYHQIAVSMVMEEVMEQ